MNMSVNEIQQAAGLPAVQMAQPLTSMSVQEQQAVARVKVQFHVAMVRPRDVNERLQEIKKLCKIPEVAADSEYSFPRGGSSVRGPNIRLAELIASNWRNFDYGLCEIHRGQGTSLCEAYAIDMEANTSYRIQFHVPHRRDKTDRESGKEGSVDLKSDRDIYEMMANMGSRRLREAIFRVVPTFVVNTAVEICRQTTQEANQKEPLPDRIKKAIPAWAALGVTQSMLAKYLKCPVAEMIEQQYQDLLVIYRTIKNHEGRIDDYFERDSAPQAQTAGTAGKKGEEPAADGKPATLAAGTKQNSKSAPAGAGAANAAGNSAPVDGGSKGAGEPPLVEGGPDPSGPPGFEDLKKDIENAKTQDEIEDIQSLMSNNPNLTKAQAAELRGKLKAKISALSLE